MKKRKANERLDRQIRLVAAAVREPFYPGLYRQIEGLPRTVQEKRRADAERIEELRSGARFIDPTVQDKDFDYLMAEALGIKPSGLRKKLYRAKRGTKIAKVS
jgi:hypothetical protein